MWAFGLAISLMPLNQHSPPTIEMTPEKIQEQIAYMVDYLEFVKKQNAWADSILATMSMEQKIGQLFMAAVYPTHEESHFKAVDKLISNYHIGGIMYFRGSPHQLTTLGNRFQEKAKTPLLCSIDAEWGLGMRVDSTINFPRAMVLGAIQNNELIYELGKEIAFQCRRIGVHINFAPVSDVNSNPKNPVIGTRSFGENPENVAQKAIAFAKGLQNHGVIATAKHFPGHGDTNSDSHKTLPTIRHDRQRLDKIELYPFKRLIKDSILSVMTAHLFVPELDDTNNQASSLSKKIVTDLLQNELGFEGLIITDGLVMKGVADYYKNGELEVKALQAGNDILLTPYNVVKSFEAVKKAVQDKKISEKDIERKVRKILKSKYYVGLHRYQAADTKNLYQDLNNPQATILRQKLYKQAVTIVKNDKNLLPFQNLDTLTFGSVAIGTQKDNEFQAILGKYAAFEQHTVLKSNSPEVLFNEIFTKVSKKKVVVVGLLDMEKDKKGANYGLNATILNFIKKLEKVTKVVVVAFGNPYSLKNFENSKHLVCAYENDMMMQRAVPQILFGAVANNARLPISASEKITEGLGQKVESLGRLEYSFIPEEVDMDSRILSRIDSIASLAIHQKATPSCQVLVAKNGKVVFSKSYGYFTYEKVKQITDEAVYDIASVTKVAATLQGIMHLYDIGKIDVEEKISTYLPELKGTNKEHIIIRNILIHQAGLVQSMPHWTKTLSKGNYKESYYRTTPSDSFNIEIKPNLYVRADIGEEVWQWLINQNLRKAGQIGNGMYGYLYTDVGFYMLKRLCDKLLGRPLNFWLQNNLYNSLGMATMGYLPLARLDKNQILPTEEDNYYRKITVQGTVHDPDAALIGGVAGHAGIFSNANDLGILLQMHLQKGYYGGKRYYKEETIPFFAHDRQQNYSRRGLGWDKPIRGFGGPSSGYCSLSTFGHTGFTGTGVWADPEHDLVFVFLANRTYPDGGKNRKIINMGIRNQIHNLVYESMGNFKQIRTIERKNP